jgi:cell fate regulator YaaT (PSP1 superfamily)
MVVVDTQSGCDVGRISLSGDLVRLQMRKKRVPVDGYFPKVVRKANERDLEKLEEVRAAEKEAMIRARAISRTLNLNMKIGDVEFQGDGKKATFYYTADGRVDFRELIRQFAKEFKIKIEMRQIGARQEASRVGGLGPCGRELCCSTWLTSYKTVGTAAARYQNLAINQAKLSGQCGRLKCCLNYELDTYMEALSNFPDDADKLKTKEGMAVLVKSDIFKGLMYYGYEKDRGRGTWFALDIKKVRAVRDAIKQGELPDSLASLAIVTDSTNVDDDGTDYNAASDLSGVVELPMEERRKKKKKKPGNTDKAREAKPTDGAAASGTQPPSRDRTAKREGSNRDRNRGSGDRKPTSTASQNTAQPPQAPKPDAPSGNAERKENSSSKNRRRGGKNRRGGGKNRGGGGGTPPSGGGE